MKASEFLGTGKHDPKNLEVAGSFEFDAEEARLMEVVRREIRNLLVASAGGLLDDEGRKALALCIKIVSEQRIERELRSLNKES